MVGWIRILTPFLMAASLSGPLSAAEPPSRTTRLPDGLRQGWYASIETAKGEILARLLAEQAPRSVASFAALAQGRLEWTDPDTGETHKEPYYDGLPINLVSAGRMFVAGDRAPLGQGTPELYVPMEGKAPIGFSGGPRFGLIRSAGRVSGVLFFVTVSALPEMEGLMPCFAEVVSGKETAFQISQMKAHPNGVPLESAFIERIRIFPVGDPPPLPEPVPYVPKRATPRFSRDAPEP